MLRKSPGFTVAAVVTLALAIGANAVVFAILNALILRPLNVPQAHSLYGIEHGSDSLGLRVVSRLSRSSRSQPQLRRSGSILTLLGRTGHGQRSSPGRGCYETSGNYFDALGSQPYLGRVFTCSDEHGPNSAPYIVLSYAFWHSHFQDDPGVVGRVVQLNKHPFTIVGVAPPDFHGTLLFISPDFFVPIVNQEQLAGEDS